MVFTTQIKLKKSRASLIHLGKVNVMYSFYKSNKIDIIHVLCFFYYAIAFSYQHITGIDIVSLLILCSQITYLKR